MQSHKKYTKTYGALACLVVSLHQYNNWKSVGVDNFYFVVFGDAIISSLHCLLAKARRRKEASSVSNFLLHHLDVFKALSYKAITANCFWWSMTSLMPHWDNSNGMEPLEKIDSQKQDDVNSKAQFIGRPDIA